MFWPSIWSLTLDQHSGTRQVQWKLSVWSLTRLIFARVIFQPRRRWASCSVSLVKQLFTLRVFLSGQEVRSNIIFITTNNPRQDFSHRQSSPENFCSHRCRLCLSCMDYHWTRNIDELRFLSTHYCDSMLGWSKENFLSGENKFCVVVNKYWSVVLKIVTFALHCFACLHYIRTYIHTYNIYSTNCTAAAIASIWKREGGKGRDRKRWRKCREQEEVTA